RLGLKNTSMARARCDTIRLKLLKIGAQVRVTFRKVWVSLAESCPYRGLFRQVYENLVGVRPIQIRC
ncbi:MAG: IS1380 family transposase, partial [Phycisphaerales bacterium]|nr:IS1380 family transposase [Phycisphaerales bacterium]